MSKSRMAALARGKGGWFMFAGPDSELVLSTRVRLARNLQGVRFPSRAAERDLTRVVGDVLAAAEACEELAPSDLLNIQDLEPLDRDVLLERHLISAEFAQGGPGRALIPGRSDAVSVMVNEEDHLRVQGIRCGLQLYECWESVVAVESALGHRLDYAFCPDLGYLTACPSNVGTAMRVSLLMHLPCLVISQEIRKVIDSVLQIGLSVRGFYGEGSDVVGNFFQISNQVTLGKSEEELLEMMEQVVGEVLKFEGRARDWLWSAARAQIEDKVYRALGTLTNCRLISTAEAVAAASVLRLGVTLRLPQMPDIDTLNRIVILSQPAHVQRISGRRMKSAERRSVRADEIRRLISTNGSASAGEI